MLDDIRIGQLAVGTGFIDGQDLEESLREQEEQEASGRYRPLGQVMVRRGLITRSQLRRLLRQQRSLAARVTRIGKYRLLALRGEGGMGALYRAQDMEGGVTVALKVLPRSHAHKRDLLERFRREALSGSLLDHPNIIQVHDADYADGYHYIAMEYVEGMSTAEMLSDSGRVGEKDVLSIAIQVTRALDHIAERGLVHRDIKPGNILVDDEGVAKLADMGLALWVERPLPRITATGHMMGTPLYISPEQAQGTDPDIRSDIYSMGGTLYELLTGLPPFRGKSATAILTKHILEDLPNPKEIERTLSDGICYVVARMMAKKPEDRYQSPRELMKDLLVVYRGEEPDAFRGRGVPAQSPAPSLMAEEALPGEVLPRERPTPLRALERRRLSTGRLKSYRPRSGSPWPAVAAGMTVVAVLLLGAGLLLGVRLGEGGGSGQAGGEVLVDFARGVPGWQGGSWDGVGLRAEGEPPVLQMTTAGVEVAAEALFRFELETDEEARLFVSLERVGGGVYVASADTPGGEAVSVTVPAAAFSRLDGLEQGLPAGRYLRLTVEAQGARVLVLQRFSAFPARLFVAGLD